MDALKDFDWSICETEHARTEMLERIIGSHVPMPDGSQHYLEMPLIAWYWMHRLIKRGRDMTAFAQDTLDAIHEVENKFDEALFNEFYQARLMAAGQGIISGLTEAGRDWTE